MKHAETVTFGGSGLDRAAHLRADPPLNEAARCLAMWRGKPLIADDAAAWLPMDHPIFQHATEVAIFLGDPDAPKFARDISDWDPPEAADTLGAFLDPSTQHHETTPDDHLFTELRAIMTQLTPRDGELIATARAVLSWHETHRHCANCGARTHIAMAGWQRDCPECQRHHFPRTDPVVIMLITHGNSTLVGRSPGWPEGMYSCLAGFVEPGETVEAAVRRETFEEAGIRVGQVDYLASQPWPFPASLMIGCHGHATTKDITLDPTEIEDAQWMTREQMMDVFAGTSPLMTPAREGAIAHFLLLNWLRDTLT